jgi:hypothetical protein
LYTFDYCWCVLFVFETQHFQLKVTDEVMEISY